MNKIQKNSTTAVAAYNALVAGVQVGIDCLMPTSGVTFVVAGLAKEIFTAYAPKGIAFLLKTQGREDILAKMNVVAEHYDSTAVKIGGVGGKLLSKTASGTVQKMVPFGGVVAGTLSALTHYFRR